MKIDKETFKDGAGLTLDIIQGMMAGIVTETTLFTGTTVLAMGFISNKHPLAAAMFSLATSLVTTWQVMNTDVIQETILASTDRTVDKLVKLIYKD